MTRGFGRFLRQNTIALLALFLVLGGTSYAAATLINGSQIKKHSIAKNRLTNKAIKQLKGNRGPRGAQGAQGARGPTGAQGIQGIQGIQGPPGPFVQAVPAGQLLRGEYAASGSAGGAGVLSLGPIGFAFPLSTAPTAHFIALGGPVPAGCSGTAAAPDASAGHLCVFERADTNRSVNGIFKSDGTGGTDTLGAIVAISSVGAGTFYSSGTWAARAPAASAPTPSAPRSHMGIPFGQ